MEFRKFGNQYVVRLDRGEEIAASLKKLCTEENIRLGSIQGLGAADHVNVGLFDVGTKVYHTKSFDMPMEITALHGSITRMDGDVYLHIHICVCDSDFHVFGGHMNECRISATCEIIVTVMDGEVGRKHSEEVGLNLYDFQ